MNSNPEHNILYIDESCTFKEEFVTEIKSMENVDITTENDIIGPISEYDYVVISDAIDGWEEKIDIIKEELNHIFLLTKSTKTLSSVDNCVSDCIYKENPEFHAEFLYNKIKSVASSAFATKEETQQKLQSYDRLMDSDLLIFYELDENGVITIASQEFAERMNESQEEVIGAHVSEYLSEKDVQRGNEILRKLLKDPSQKWNSFEIRIDHRHTERWYLNHITPTIDEEGEFSGSIGVLYDITDRKERNEELKLFEAMVRSVPEPVWAVDEHGYYMYMSEAIHQFGLEPDDIEGTHAKKWFSEDGYERIREGIFGLLASDTKDAHIGEYEFDFHGTNRPFEVHLSLIDPETTDLEGTVGIIRDISERKEREQRLNVLNRVFRHNIRNSLAVIKARSELIREDSSEKNQSHAKQIFEESNQIERTSEKAKQIGKFLNEKPDRRKRDLLVRIQDVISSYSESDIELTYSRPESAEAYFIDGMRFALENILENSIKHNDEDELIVDVTVEKRDESILIRIADNGNGIPDNELAVLKQEKEDSLVHGSGLGLWAVHWIVQRSKGDLSFGESEYGGAEVTIELSRTA